VSQCERAKRVKAGGALVESSSKKHLAILGTRGIPAAHGGFETFAEHLALFLTTRGWKVTVYCQADGGTGIKSSSWCGIDLVHVGVNLKGAAGTVEFDLKSILHSARRPALILTLGYNTAVLCAIFKATGHKNLINMDGIEWKRQKWGSIAKLWLRLNEKVATLLADHMIADHPRIRHYLGTITDISRVTTIPYEAEVVGDAPSATIGPIGLTSKGYALIVARPEPENSLLEIVKAWSSRERGASLVVLGRLLPSNPYHKSVLEAAGPEVVFPGAIYDKAIVEALRFHARFYIHGHQVGGTNPSLVETLACGTAVVAHDNEFNRWTAGDAALFFKTEVDLRQCIERAFDEDVCERMRRGSRAQYLEKFTPEKVLGDYENLLARYLPVTAGAGEGPVLREY
jgi:glycosyltransferase involved in cell wall biosynthesis